MKIYILRPKEECGKWDCWYDKSFGHIVRAIDETQARSLASNESGDEGKEAWLSETYSSCDILTVEGNQEHIMEDFRQA